MKKRLTCRAMGLNCDFAVHEESEDEIVRMIADHLKSVHGIEFTEQLGSKARDLIRLVEV